MWQVERAVLPCLITDLTAEPFMVWLDQQCCMHAWLIRRSTRILLVQVGAIIAESLIFFVQARMVMMLLRLQQRQRPPRLAAALGVLTVSPKASRPYVIRLFCALHFMRTLSALCCPAIVAARVMKWACHMRPLENCMMIKHACADDGDQAAAAAAAAAASSGIPPMSGWTGTLDSERHRSRLSGRLIAEPQNWHSCPACPRTCSR